MLDRSPPLHNFVTMKTWFFSQNFSMIARTFLWGWQTFNAWDSEIPFLSFSWSYLLASMAFMATRPPVFFKKASKTWLFWPSLISLAIWYWSSFELNPWASRILAWTRSLSRLVSNSAVWLGTPGVENLRGYQNLFWAASLNVAQISLKESRIVRLLIHANFGVVRL